MIIDSPVELEAEGDRIFNKHAAWMEKTHYREGEKALLQYNVAKSSGDNGNIIVVLTEVYESVAGIDDHIEQAHNDDHFEAFSKWRARCKVTFVRDASIIHSPWQRSTKVDQNAGREYARQSS
jgi:quinol monooxygenase YgiN